MTIRHATSVVGKSCSRKPFDNIDRKLNLVCMKKPTILVWKVSKFINDVSNLNCI